MNDYDLPSPTPSTNDSRFSDPSSTDDDDDDDEHESNGQHRYTMRIAECLLTGMTYLTRHMTYAMFCDFFHHQTTNNNNNNNVAQAEYMQMRCNTLEWLNSLCNDDRRRVIQWAYQAPNLPRGSAVTTCGGDKQ
jgi:hypothetical protein